jgi:HEAT repeat protein
MDIIEEAIKRFEEGFHSPKAEWEYLNSLIGRSESERFPLLKWGFLESPASWDTRAKAGLALFEEDERDTWQLIEKLVDSSDPDDNGTALTIFERMGDPRGMQLAQRWLTDQAPTATQFEAIDYLRGVYPELVRERLHALSSHAKENVRRRAQKVLAEFGP